MLWSDIDFHPSDQKLRTFAGLFCIATVGLGTWQLHAHANSWLAAALLTTGAVIALLGILNPFALRPLYAWMMIVSFPMGWLTSHVLLAVVYFALFTPLALLFRWLGRDRLRLRAGSTVSSYLEMRPVPGDNHTYFRPF
jgi:hypothetical protein